MTQQSAILESIRDIIAGKEPTGEDVQNDDILDLTQKLNEDGSVTELKLKTLHPEVNAEVKEVPEPEPEPEMPAFMAEPPKKSGDILSEIDALLAEDKFIQPPRSEEPIEIVLSDVQPEPAPAFEEITKQDFIQQPIQQETTTMSDALISENSVSSTKASIANLVSKLGDQNKANGPNFKSGETVEHIVAEMLKPMMKDWLDANLPKLVNQIVEREIAKIMANQ